MARDAIVLGDSDGEANHVKARSVKDSAVNAEEHSEVENAEDGEDDEEEEEYEIEGIMDSQRASKGKFRYFVKWKGYDESHNSWVEEDDAGNATELINTYWRSIKGKKAAGRKSAAPASEKGSESSTSAAKKRGRTSAKQESDIEEIDDGERLSAAKKARKSNGTSKSVKKSESVAPMEVDESETEHVGDMSKYAKYQSWEKLIKSIDTVEKGDDGDLLVYFTMKQNSDKHVQPSSVCREKFPQLLLEFYESHLRWKQVESGDT